MLYKYYLSEFHTILNHGMIRNIHPDSTTGEDVNDVLRLFAQS